MLDRLDHIVARMAAYEPGNGADALRGDHQLSPHLKPSPPWTQAAVLVPLIDHNDGLTVLLTRRTDHLTDHPGQISFPGGRFESGDVDAEAAALRETEEELGIPRARVELLGRLDTYITRTGFDVTPIVGVITPPFSLRPDSFEVADVFEVPLAFLIDPGNYMREERLGVDRATYYYAVPYEDRYIWGATAGMLKNLCEALGD